MQWKAKDAYVPRAVFLSASKCFTNNLILLSIFQDLAKKDDGNPDKSDDETEKKAENEDEEGAIEEEEYEEEDIEEVG